MEDDSVPNDEITTQLYNAVSAFIENDVNNLTGCEVTDYVVYIQLDQNAKGAQINASIGFNCPDGVELKINVTNGRPENDFFNTVKSSSGPLLIVVGSTDIQFDVVDEGEVLNDLPTTTTIIEDDTKSSLTSFDDLLLLFLFGTIVGLIICCGVMLCCIYREKKSQRKLILMQVESHSSPPNSMDIVPPNSINIVTVPESKRDEDDDDEDNDLYQQHSPQTDVALTPVSIGGITADVATYGNQHDYDNEQGQSKYDQDNTNTTDEDEDMYSNNVSTKKQTLESDGNHREWKKFFSGYDVLPACLLNVAHLHKKKVFQGS